MINGRGWICIALVVFASWRPGKALLPFDVATGRLVDDVWARSDSEPAQEFAMLAYPAYQVSDETVALTDAWLEREPSQLLDAAKVSRDYDEDYLISTYRSHGHALALHALVEGQLDGRLDRPDAVLRRHEAALLPRPLLARGVEDVRAGKLIELELARQGRTRVQVNRQRMRRARDLLGAVEAAAARPDIDGSRVGVYGESYGGPPPPAPGAGSVVPASPKSRRRTYSYRFGSLDSSTISSEVFRPTEGAAAVRRHLTRQGGVDRPQAREEQLAHALPAEDLLRDDGAADEVGEVERGGSVVVRRITEDHLGDRQIGGGG